MLNVYSANTRDYGLKMHILYLSPHIPNPTKVRSYHQVIGLKRAGQQVAVAAPLRSSRELEHVRQLEAMGIPVLFEMVAKQEVILNAISALFGNRPIQAELLWSTSLFGKMQRYLDQYSPDIIHVEHLRMAKYGLRLKQEWPVVWDAVDNLGSLYQQATTSSATLIWRLLGRLEASRLKTYEYFLASKFALTLVISKHDQRHFSRKDFSTAHIQVAPFGLPLERYEPVSRSTNVLILTGTLDYHPNVASVHYFVNEIFPIVVGECPNVKLQLVGARPVPSIRRLSSEQIEVTGFVPSVSDRLLQSTVALAPVTYGSGTQIKVLEAFATETPLVATSIALRGLEVIHNQHALVANSASEFAEAVIKLLKDSQLRRRLGKAGGEYVRHHHDLARTTSHLIDMYSTLLSSYNDLERSKGSTLSRE